MAGDTTERVAAFDPTAVPPRHLAGVLGVGLLAAMPMGVDPITVIKLTSALYFAVFVMTWDVVSGYTGQISFGHALFFGVGGYTSGMLNVHLGVGLALAIPAGVLAATIAGLVIGVPALRVRGPYLSLITLVAPVILQRTFVYYSEWTGGEVGLISVAPAGRSLAKLSQDPLVNYYVAFGLFVAVLATFVAVTRSDAGTVFTAIREDEEAVAASGINPAKFKIFAFVLSAAVGGLAGAMFAHSTAGSVTPSQLLALTVSIEVIIAAILGGMGTIVGAGLGGLVFFMLRDSLRNLAQLEIPLYLLPVRGPLPGRVVIDLVVPGLGIPLEELDLLLFGLITLGFLFFVPEGILPRSLRYGRAVHARLRATVGRWTGGDGA